MFRCWITKVQLLGLLQAALDGGLDKGYNGQQQLDLIDSIISWCKRCTEAVLGGQLDSLASCWEIWWIVEVGQLFLWIRNHMDCNFRIRLMQYLDFKTEPECTREPSFPSCPRNTSRYNKDCPFPHLLWGKGHEVQLFLLLWFTYIWVMPFLLSFT